MYARASSDFAAEHARDCSKLDRVNMKSERFGRRAGRAGNQLRNDYAANGVVHRTETGGDPGLPGNPRCSGPEVLAVITKANIRNYSIFLREPENILFAYWEYHGSDFAADAAVMAQDPAMQKW